MPDKTASPHRRTSTRKAAAAVTKYVGSTNRKRYQFTSVPALVERFGDPRAILMEIASTPTEKLAQALDCTLLEALENRRHCAVAVLPYLASKMPVQVDMRHTRAVHVHFEGDPEPLTLEPARKTEPVIDLTADDITDTSS